MLRSILSASWRGVLLSVLIALVQLFTIGSNLWTIFTGSKVLPSLTDDVGLLGGFTYLVLPVLFFVLAHAAVALVATALAILCQPLRPRMALKELSLILLLLLWATIFLENTRLFPGSIFALKLTVPAGLQGFSLWLLWLAGLLGVVGLRLLQARGRGRLNWALLGVLASSGLLGWAYPQGQQTSRVAVVQRQPNVIIIGVDSLRRDLVGAMGAEHSLTPNIDALLHSGAAFANAYTPIARTYPSWMGILSGRYPIHSGARVNLMSPAMVDRQALLPVLLQEQGYRTVYAMDERRFSNIDESYGFERVVGPGVGVQDFLAGAVDDMPLINLLAASALGPYALPYHYSNRALALTYQPRDFLQFISSALAEKSERPLFLAAHFCLPHWPYAWGGAKRQPATPYDAYLGAIAEADRQVGALLADLKARGYLENAIVVLLSDHGEAHGLPSDMPFSMDNKPMAAIYGHGTNVLSPTQHQVLLGLRGFGASAAQIMPGRHQELATLLDVTPTLADLLHLKLPWSADGLSLAGQISGSATKPVERTVFLETEFDLQQVNQAAPDIKRLIAEGVGYFRLTDAGRIELTADALRSIIQAKQRAVLHEKKMLAFFPGSKQSRLIMANLEDRTARRFSGTTCKQDASCEQLLATLQAFYGTEIGAAMLDGHIR